MTIQRQIEVNVLCIFLEPCICVCLHCDFQDHFLSLEEEEACGFFIQCNGALRSNPSYIETEGYFITCTVSIILLMLDCDITGRICQPAACYCNCSGSFVNINFYMLFCLNLIAFLIRFITEDTACRYSALASKDDFFAVFMTFFSTIRAIGNCILYSAVFQGNSSCRLFIIFITLMHESDVTGRCIIQFIILGTYLVGILPLSDNCQLLICICYFIAFSVRFEVSYIPDCILGFIRNHNAILSKYLNCTFICCILQVLFLLLIRKGNNYRFGIMNRITLII